MEIFCAIFENSVDHPLPNIDPHQPLSELSRLPREKLERAFRQLKKVMIQSYNARIFFPDPQHQYQQQQYQNDAEFHHSHPHAVVPPLSIMSAPSACSTVVSQRSIPTQNQIAKRLTKLAAAASKQQSQSQQPQNPQQQQQQYYVDYEQQQHPPIAYQYYNHQQLAHSQQLQQQQQQQLSLPSLPLPPTLPSTLPPTNIPMTQSLQPIAATTGNNSYPYYVQPAYQPSYQPTTLQLATTPFTATDVSLF
uniref:Uncharacterized protein n=1 Tax=Panagrolaimus superbus TaxID=310955 RepID=A0A914Y4A2_9BILA